MSLTTTLAVLGVALLFEAWRSHVRLRNAVAPRGPLSRGDRRDDYPSVTVIRPTRGLDWGAEENIRAALDNGYPGDVQTLFVFDDDREPAVPLVRAAIERHRAEGGRGDADVVFCGPPPKGRTGKLNAMLAGLRRARGELVAFVDSDVRADRDALRSVVDALRGDPKAGAAFAPVVVSEPPATIGDVGYALMLNGLYGPAVEQAVRESGGSLPFIMGQFMVLRREALTAIGGLESLSGQLVDDMYLGALIDQAGLKNMVAPHYVSIVQRDLTPGDFWSVYVRWITFSRTGLAGRSVRTSSVVRALTWWAGLAAAAVAAVVAPWWVAALLLATPLGISASMNHLHERLGGAPLPLRFRWVAFAVLLAGPAVYAVTLTRRRLAWRGRTYDLDASSKLASSDGAAGGAESNAMLTERAHRV